MRGVARCGTKWSKEYIPIGKSWQIREKMILGNFFLDRSLLTPVLFMQPYYR